MKIPPPSLQKFWIRSPHREGGDTVLLINRNFPISPQELQSCLNAHTRFPLALFSKGNTDTKIYLHMLF